MGSGASTIRANTAARRAARDEINRIVTTGNIFYVDSGHADKSDTSTQGRHPGSPFATIDYAIGQCTANNGDIIYAMPGHSETVAAAAGIDFDVAGISLIGLGVGASRATIAMSATGSTVHIDAADTYIENMLFTTSAAVVIMIDCDESDFWCVDCEFRMGTAVTAIELDGGTANDCDRANIHGCVFDASTDGPDEAILLGEVADSVVIDGCWAYGLFDDACIHNPTGSVLTWLRITNNYLVNTTASAHSIELVSASTGIIANNRCGSPLATPSRADIDGGSCHILENYSHDAAANNSGLVNPVIDS